MLQIGLAVGLLVGFAVLAHRREQWRGHRMAPWLLAGCCVFFSMSAILDPATRGPSLIFAIFAGSMALREMKRSRAGSTPNAS